MLCYLAGEPGTEDTRIFKNVKKKGHKSISASTTDPIHRFDLSLPNKKSDTHWFVAVDAFNQLETTRVI
jgi:hypothetical protein